MRHHSSSKFTCPLCYEPYTSTLPHCPRILSCGHTFCEECLGKIYHGIRPECPKCRATNLFSIEKLPKNFDLIPEALPKIHKRNLTEFLSSLELKVSPSSSSTECCNVICNGTELENVIYCELCDPLDELHPASYECPECNEKMCDILSKVHGKQKLTKNHILVPLQTEAMILSKEAKNHDINNNNCNDDNNNNKRRRIGSVIIPKSILCKEHAKPLDYFDDLCQQLNCMECCMNEHKGKEEMIVCFL
jgi:hypothetical protein